MIDMPTKRQIGDMAEKAVAEALRKQGYIVEIHPRTFRLIHIGKLKTIQISQDNDYHNCFDIKAEGEQGMIYVQVKTNKTDISRARHKIDKLYPHDFPYQKIQVWHAVRSWVPHPRRHKEFTFRVWERRGSEWLEIGD